MILISAIVSIGILLQTHTDEDTHLQAHKQAVADREKIRQAHAEQTRQTVVAIEQKSKDRMAARQAADAKRKQDAEATKAAKAKKQEEEQNAPNHN